jgi:hypothetical protein
MIAINHQVNQVIYQIQYVKGDNQQLGLLRSGSFRDILPHGHSPFALFTSINGNNAIPLTLKKGTTIILYRYPILQQVAGQVHKPLGGA